MFDKMKQLMELKKQADELKRVLEAEVLEINEVRGIKIVVNAAQSFRSIEIDENLLTPQNKNRIQMDLIRSINTAIKKSQQIQAQKARGITGLNIPGLT